MTTMTEDAIYTAVKNFITQFTSCPASCVVKGWQNRVSMPKSGFVLMEIISQSSISTNIHDYHYSALGNSSVDVGRGVRVRFQIDCYGENAFDWASKIQAFCTDYEGMRVLEAGGVSSVLVSEIRNIPIVSSEQMYEARYMLEMALYYTCSFNRSQDFFVTATPNKIKPIQ